MHRGHPVTGWPQCVPGERRAVVFLAGGLSIWGFVLASRFEATRSEEQRHPVRRVGGRSTRGARVARASSIE
jgi:hypothetical protein